jgi:3'-phosphoadenosine 5'-phosphosulfate sulfotransferase (PAPS reductase)/FAD synthetase
MTAGKLGYLESGKAKVMVVDTFHLFDDTMPFLAELEKKYKFKAEIFQVMACVSFCHMREVALRRFSISHGAAQRRACVRMQGAPAVAGEISALDVCGFCILSLATQG